MEGKFDIYFKRDQAFAIELKKLKECSTSARNKELIIQFQAYLFSTESKQLRVAKVSSQLRRMCLVLKKDLGINKDLDRLDYEDIQALVGFFNRQDCISEATKSDYRRAIKQFFRWFKDLDERLESQDNGTTKKAQKLYKYVEKELRTAYRSRKIDFSTLLSNEDIDLVIMKGCKTIKEKAFIKMLHETGCRAGEFLGIMLKDIKIMENKALIQVSGKTGERIIPILESIPYLVQWLDLHPFKDNKEAYLWTGDSPSRLYQPIRHIGGKRLISRCFNRARVTKKHNFHHFRHSRATLLAPKLRETMLCKYMGWVLASKQVRNYVHLDTKQLEEEILQIHGMEEKKETPQRRVQVCTCGSINTPTGRYCYKCGKPLNVAVVLQDEAIIKEETNKTVLVLQEIMQNPELFKRFLEFKRGLELEGETKKRSKDQSS